MSVELELPSNTRWCARPGEQQQQTAAARVSVLQRVTKLLSGGCPVHLRPCSCRCAHSADGSRQDQEALFRAGNRVSQLALFSSSLSLPYLICAMPRVSVLQNLPPKMFGHLYSHTFQLHSLKVALWITLFKLRYPLLRAWVYRRPMFSCPRMSRLEKSSLVCAALTSQVR